MRDTFCFWGPFYRDSYRVATASSGQNGGGSVAHHVMFHALLNSERPAPRRSPIWRTRAQFFHSVLPLSLCLGCFFRNQRGKLFLFMSEIWKNTKFEKTSIPFLVCFENRYFAHKPTLEGLKNRFDLLITRFRVVERLRP